MGFRAGPGKGCRVTRGLYWSGGGGPLEAVALRDPMTAVPETSYSLRQVGYTVSIVRAGVSKNRARPSEGAYPC